MSVSLVKKLFTKTRPRLIKFSIRRISTKTSVKLRRKRTYYQKPFSKYAKLLTRSYTTIARTRLGVSALTRNKCYKLLHAQRFFASTSCYLTPSDEPWEKQVSFDSTIDKVTNVEKSVGQPLFTTPSFGGYKQTVLVDTKDTEEIVVEYIMPTGTGEIEYSVTLVFSSKSLYLDGFITKPDPNNGNKQYYLHFPDAQIKRKINNCDPVSMENASSQHQTQVKISYDNAKGWFKYLSEYICPKITEGKVTVNDDLVHTIDNLSFFTSEALRFGLLKKEIRDAIPMNAAVTINKETGTHTYIQNWKQNSGSIYLANGSISDVDKEEYGNITILKQQ